MKYYWKDIYNDHEIWQALELSIEGLTIPKLQLLSGSKWKTKLVYQDLPLFWAKNKNYYYVDLIRTFKENSRLIGHITSHDIEYRQNIKTAEYFKSWSLFFIEKMIKENNHFFNHSLWHFKGLYKFVANANYYQPITGSSTFEVYEKLKWANDLIYSRRVDEYSGRLKWWRKKAIEGSLPPIFAWYIPSLGGYWIIDGNYRLRAAILEKKDIPVVLTYSGKYCEPIPNNKLQQEIFLTLDKIKKYKGQISESTKIAFNQSLIEAYDNRPYFKLQTSARATITSDHIWLNEINDYLKSIDYPDYSILVSQFKDDLSNPYIVLE